MSVTVAGQLFETDEPDRTRPVEAVPKVTVEASQDDLTPVAGAALWGPLLDRVNLVDIGDRARLRQVGPTGISGGECLRALCETMLAGGDFISDVSLLADPATQQLRGGRHLPSHDTLWRFCDDADIGTVTRAAGANRVLLERLVSLAQRADPGKLDSMFDDGVVTVDPDATKVATYGKAKQGSKFSYQFSGTCLHPIVGVLGETGHVLAVRARGGNRTPRGGLGSFTRDCIDAVPGQLAHGRQVWVRVDSAGHQASVIDTCIDRGAWFSITATKRENTVAAIEAVATDPTTGWVAAKGHEGRLGSQVCETTLDTCGRTLRLIVRRQPVGSDGDAQLSFDDVDGWRFHAIITNIPAERDAVAVEAHHRNRGGIPEDAIRRLKNHFGFNHAPLGKFHANALWQQICVAAYNIGLWLQTHTLPDEFARARGKRLRLAFFNVAARLGHHAGGLQLKFARAYRWVDGFAAAINRLHALPAYG